MSKVDQSDISLLTEKNILGESKQRLIQAVWVVECEGRRSLMGGAPGHRGVHSVDKTVTSLL